MVRKSYFIVLLLFFLSACSTRVTEVNLLIDSEKVTTNSAIDSSILWKAGPMYKEGNFIYSTVPFAAAGEPIISYNILTGEIKEIIQTENKDENGIKYFREIIAKGDYIYCVGELDVGWEIKGRTFIYKISKDGRTRNMLACGDNMVLIDDRIYFDEKVIYEKAGKKCTKYTGKKCSIKLDGSDMREEINVEAQESYSSDIVANQYEYFISDDGTKIYKRNVKTKKKEKLIETEADEKMLYLAFSNEYIQIIGEHHIYITDINGESFVEINAYNTPAI